MAQDALEVHIVAVPACEYERGHAVADQAEGADRGDAHAVDIRRVGEPPDRLDEHPRRHGDQQQAVQQRGEDLRPAIPERAPSAGGARGRPRRGDSQSDGADVGEHMARVGEQRDRVEGQPAGDGRGQHHQVDRERDRHPAGVAGVVRVMVVVHVHGVSLAHCLR